MIDRRDAMRGMLATVVAAILWSTGGLLIKWIEQPAFTILFYRSLFAGLFFLFLFRGKAMQWDRQVLRISLCYAPLLICFVTATKLTTAANAIFLQYTAPVFVLLAEPRILGTRLQRLDVITVVVSLAGLSLFLLDSFQASGSWIGNGVALMSGLFLAGLILTLKFSDARQQAGGLVLGNLWVVLATAWWWGGTGTIIYPEWGWLVFLGIVQIGLGYVFYTYGQRRIAAIDGALLAMLEPALNPLWVGIGIGEWPSLWSMAGGGILLVALAARLVVLHAPKPGR